MVYDQLNDKDHICDILGMVQEDFSKEVEFSSQNLNYRLYMEELNFT